MRKNQVRHHEPKPSEIPLQIIEEAKVPEMEIESFEIDSDPSLRPDPPKVELVTTDNVLEDLLTEDALLTQPMQQIFAGLQNDKSNALMIERDGK